MVVENHYSNQQSSALIITSVLHALIILLCLYLFTWTVPDPLPEAEVMELELLQVGLGGNNPNAGGGGGGSPSKATAASVSGSQANANIVTSNNTDAPFVPTGSSTNVKPTNSNTKPNNPNALFSNQSDGDGTGNGNGNGSGDGPGNGSGNGSGDGDGDGPGKGSGTEAGVLEGRMLMFKPKITDRIEAEGKVVVNIWVDQEGKVTRASINEALSNTNNSELRRIALANAKKVKWSANDKAAVEQKGTYTINFTLK